MVGIIHNARVSNKYDLEVNWRKNSGFIPLPGEIIIYSREIDENGNILELPDDRTTAFPYERIKVGDGKTFINDLNFAVEHLAECSEADIMALFEGGQTQNG
jgi:hypothetical protein